MTQYLLSVYMTEDAENQTDLDVEAVYAAVDQFNEKLRSSGAWVFAGGLTEISDATTVDNTAGENLVVDGPYAESKEYLGGFWIIEVPDLDAALQWAAEGSAACAGKVEVRPFEPVQAV